MQPFPLSNPLLLGFSLAVEWLSLSIGHWLATVSLLIAGFNFEAPCWMEFLDHLLCVLIERSLLYNELLFFAQLSSRFSISPDCEQLFRNESFFDSPPVKPFLERASQF